MSDQEPMTGETGFVNLTENSDAEGRPVKTDASLEVRNWTLKPKTGEPRKPSRSKNIKVETVVAEVRFVGDAEPPSDPG